MAALLHVRPSQIRDRIHISCPGRWILYHWATREALQGRLYSSLSASPCEGQASWRLKARTRCDPALSLSCPLLHWPPSPSPSPAFSSAFCVHSASSLSLQWSQPCLFPHTLPRSCLSSGLLTPGRSHAVLRAGNTTPCCDPRPGWGDLKALVVPNAGLSSSLEASRKPQLPSPAAWPVRALQDQRFSPAQPLASPLSRACHEPWERLSQHGAAVFQEPRPAAILWPHACNYGRPGKAMLVHLEVTGWATHFGKRRCLSQVNSLSCISPYVTSSVNKKERALLHGWVWGLNHLEQQPWLPQTARQGWEPRGVVPTGLKCFLCFVFWRGIHPRSPITQDGKKTRTQMINQWIKGFPGGASGEEPTCQRRRQGFDPRVRKIPWSQKWQPTPVLLPGESHGQRSLVGYSPWGHKELNMTERLRMHARHITPFLLFFRTSSMPGSTRG